MKKVLSIFGSIVGTISIILSAVIFDLNIGSYESSKSYGGDAYTGIQNAAAQSANNIMALAKIVAFGFGSVLLIAGLTLIIYSIKSLINDIQTDKEKSLSQTQQMFNHHSTTPSNSTAESVSVQYWYCDKCNQKNPTSLKYCTNCSQSRPNTPECTSLIHQHYIQDAKNTNGDNSNTYWKTSALTNTKVLVCRHCGKELLYLSPESNTQNSVMMPCPKCGAMQPANKTICSNCKSTLY